MTDLLPEESKTHKMQTRNTNKFKVNFANTGRLKDASIIHMQNLLNDDNEQHKEETLAETNPVMANYSLLSNID